MAFLIKWCMTCEKEGKSGEYGRQESANLTKDERSHGYCDPHAVEYMADIRKQLAERKAQKGQK